MSDKVEVYLTKKKNAVTSDDVAQSFKQMEDLYAKKQWYQLSELIGQLIKDPVFIQMVDLMELYEDFIKETEHRFNPLHLARIVISIAKWIFLKDKDGAIEFLKKFEKTLAKDDLSLALLKTGQVELILANVDNNGKCIDVSQVKTLLNETREAIDKFGYLTPVHPRYYKMTSRYMDYTCDFASYYHETLKYLSCEEAELLPKDGEESRTYAIKLIVAEILGEDLYDFGVLIANPIIESLKGTDFEWMIQMLNFINSGNLDGFYNLRPKWQQFSEIISCEKLAKEKIRLFCFMEVAMSNKAIPYSLLAEKAQINKEEVEFLAMKAFSRGLVWGSIDQIDETINIEWVKPRALSLEQMKVLAERVSQWRVAVNQMGDLIQTNAQDILAKM